MRQCLTFPLFLGIFAVVYSTVDFLDFGLEGVCGLDYCFGCGVGVRLMKRKKEEEGDQVADNNLFLGWSSVINCGSLVVGSWHTLKISGPTKLMNSLCYGSIAIDRDLYTQKTTMSNTSARLQSHCLLLQEQRTIGISSQ